MRYYNVTAVPRTTRDETQRSRLAQIRATSAEEALGIFREPFAQDAEALASYHAGYQDSTLRVDELDTTGEG